MSISSRETTIAEITNTVDERVHRFPGSIGQLSRWTRWVFHSRSCRAVGTVRLPLDPTKNPIAPRANQHPMTLYMIIEKTCSSSLEG